MESLITIATFTLPSELAIIKGRLESEGIECFVADELTVQVVNFYSNAVGGIKLQVRSSDRERAIEILKEAGIEVEDDTQASAFWDKLEKLTKNIPIVKGMAVHLRLIVLTTIILIVLSALIIIPSIPSDYDNLTENNWCMHKMTFEGQDYSPSSGGFSIDGLDFCNEKIIFKENNIVDFPGFSSNRFKGKWSLSEGIVTIQEVDTFKHVFEGLYQMEIDAHGSRLILRSEQTTILCYKSEY